MCVFPGTFILPSSKISSLLTQERDGWYTTHAIERIKIVLRHKYFSLLDGHRATDEECNAILESGSLGGTEENTKMVYRDVRRLRRGKHNMAKGAQRPEDAAVCFAVHSTHN